jgi:hypothetical protein
LPAVLVEQPLHQEVYNRKSHNKQQPPTIHRCDLSRAWCARRGMPAAWARCALVCEGVRHALGRLLAELAGPVGLPRDVYPVYAQIAERAGAATRCFATFPALDLARVWATDARHVVLPCLAPRR